MRTRLAIVAATLACLGAHAAWAADIVKLDKGKVEGQISAMSPTEVTVSEGGTSKKIPVNRIEIISFDEDPALVRRARESVREGRYEDALKALENVKEEDIQRAELKQDIEFYAALSSAKLALDGKLEIPEAGKRMAAFVSANPQSYHYFQASEMLGDLYAALGQLSKARDYYDRVGKAPWPEYKLRAALSMGQLLLAETKPEEALKYFQHVLDANAEGEQADARRVAAVLGKARCLVEAGKADEAVKLAEGVIAKPEIDDADVLGRAYLVLGLAHRKAGRAQEAMYALLRVDTMYSGNRDAHAEALANLIPVFTALKKSDRAKEAKDALEAQYGDTRFAQPSE